MVEPERERVLVLLASAFVRRQREQRVRRGHVPCGNPASSGATACVRVGALAAAGADRLAGQDPAPRLVARHGLGEAQAGVCRRPS